MEKERPPVGFSDTKLFWLAWVIKWTRMKNQTLDLHSPLRLFLIYLSAFCPSFCYNFYSYQAEVLSNRHHLRYHLRPWFQFKEVKRKATNSAQVLDTGRRKRHSIYQELFISRWSGWSNHLGVLETRCLWVVSFFMIKLRAYYQKKERRFDARKLTESRGDIPQVRIHPLLLVVLFTIGCNVFNLLLASLLGA